ncbi:right-handed parallel beta-helix repeat-containing protein [Kutzneria kofuensis]|uniref:Parallel beta helix pectate lyase-like protein n=1 Tax=Kutzneria kofuensis TaxID=103725 RepID=A0A7W9NKM9_9PSEU|nr:right-handed parallel beta-helix repeat-containing protein [Kutzneria kofuensis]MBB5896195.1 hypothetical protein [Kutzneria kofuensis]
MRATAIAAALTFLLTGVAQADPAPPPFTVYLDPAGSDANNGLSTSTAVRTLARAQDVITAARPQADVQVRIKQGTYTAPTTTWTFVVPGHTVTFMPVDYQYGGGIDDIAGRPVFRGNGTAGYWFKGRMPDSATAGGDGGLRFYYLQVQDYSEGGIALAGRTTTDSATNLRVPADAGFNHNKVFGLEFVDIGSKWSSAGYAYGGVDLVNSSDNVVQNNHFVHLENAGGDADLLHGVYLAHGSSRNVVSGNQFAYVSGDPVRVRNGSDDNDVYGNTLTRSGQRGLLSDWFCDTTTGCVSPGHPRECASHGNLFHDNDNVSGYDGSSISNWATIVGDLDYAGGAPCSLGGEARIRTWGNT